MDMYSMAWLVWFCLAACRVVSASDQTEAIAEISGGRCNVSSDALLCSAACAFFVVNCTPSNPSDSQFSYSLDFRYYAVSSLPESIGALTGLRELILNDDKIDNASSLARSELSGTIPTTIGGMTSLRVLSLTNTIMLNGSFPTELGQLAMLEVIELTARQPRDYYFLSGTIPTELGRLSRLTKLALLDHQIDLSLDRLLPLQLFNCTSLEFLWIHDLILDRAGSQRSTVPTEIGLLRNLTFVELYFRVQGTLPTEIGLCRKLAVFSIRPPTSYSLSGTIPTELGQLEMLQEFKLSSHYLLSGTIPSEFGRLAHLTVLEMEECKLTGRIPNELWNLSRLMKLYLSYNGLEGTIPPAIGSMRNLTRLHVAYNRMTGSLPEDIYSLPLNFFAIDGNQFSGTLSTRIGLMSWLETLSLNSNYFSGTLPSEIGNLLGLVSIAVDSNRFSGSIPQFQLLRSLKTLTLSSNNFTFLPKEIFGLQLYQLRVDKNSLSHLDVGNSPSGLSFLNLAENLITGTIPAALSLFRTISDLDLSFNRFEAAIPVEWFEENAFPLLRQLSLAGNMLNGTIPLAIGKYRLQSLSLGANQFSGTIPQELKKMSQLTKLSLQSNLLTGTIPAFLFVSLPLKILELAFNSFSAIEPSNETESRNLLEIISLENNQISGTFPEYILTFASKLKSLILNSNKISGPFPPTFISPFLQRILLNDNEITSFECRLTPLLTSLELQRNKIENVTLKSLPSLTNVDLTNNRLVDFPDFLFEGVLGSTIPTLSVHLKENQINASVPTRLFNWKMRRLDLSQNKIYGHAKFRFFTPTNALFGANNVSRCIDRSQLKPEERSITISQNRMAGVPFYDIAEVLVLENARIGNEICRKLLSNDDVSGDSTFRQTTNPQEYDRCAARTHECSHYCSDGWFPSLSYTCRCNGTYYLEVDGVTCTSCFLSDWKPVRATTNDFAVTWEPFLRNWIANETLVGVYGGYTCSHCNGKRHLHMEVKERDECQSFKDDQVEACDYPCAKTNLDRFTGSPSAELQFYATQFAKGGFLDYVLRHGMQVSGASVSVNQEKNVVRDLFKTVFVMDVQLPGPCGGVADNVTDMMSALLHTIGQIDNNLEGISFANCTISVKLSTTPSPLVPIILAILAFLLLLGIAVSLVVYFYYFKSILHQLPLAASWSLWKYTLSPWKWEYEKSKFESGGFYFTQFAVGSTEWNKVIGLFHDHLDGARFEVKNIVAVYNPNLTASFILNYGKMRTRLVSQASLFHSQTFTTRKKERNFVLQKYNRLLQTFEWIDKDDSALTLVPVVHATGWNIGLSIAQSGFCNLSKYDIGYYGKGIYFASSAFYTVRYMQQKVEPTIIISWIMPGNVYPVVEHPLAKDNIQGHPIKSGHTSHYILTNIVGNPVHFEEDCYDEFAIDQENQLLPVFLLTFDANKFESVAKEYLSALNECNNEVETRVDGAAMLAGGDVVNKRNPLALVVDINSDLDESNGEVELESEESERRYLSEGMGRESEIELNSLRERLL